ncbi:Probable cation-transporting ATPase F [Raoultella terrigena]|uniref:Probable cation-transporting ATPase F n=1 Tax=Raoultella terrigena TaxID=577 RepID=A0A4U9DEL0_RAOTE|nr:Probable cation-transporting ATPase F [Raoultella terrigena]
MLETWLRTIDLCNDSQIIQDERGLWGITGGPTEGALKVLAAKAQLAPVETRLIAKIPFDSQYKYMATLQQIGDEERVLITGAPGRYLRHVPPADEQAGRGAVRAAVLGR